MAPATACTSSSSPLLARPGLELYDVELGGGDAAGHSSTAPAASTSTTIAERHPADLARPRRARPDRRAATPSRCRAPGSSGRCAPPRTSPAPSATSVKVKTKPDVEGERRLEGTVDRGRRRRGHRRRRPTARAPTAPLRRHRAGPHGLRVGPGAQARQDEEAEATTHERRTSDMLEALQALAADKGISVDTLLGALADALESAYKRMPGAHEYAWVTIDPDTFEIRVFAQELDEDGERTAELDVTPDDFGRIAAQTAKQVHDAAHPRGRARAEVRGVRRPRGRHRHRHHPAERQPLHAARPRPGRGAAAAGRAGALRAARARAPGSRRTSSRSAAPPRARRSSCRRTHPGLIQRLFELEVPEIADGVVEIKACAREPGHRTKIAVWSNDPNVDPVGACVGARGARVRMVVNELRGEKIDIVPFSEDPADFVMKALSPAKVKEVRIDEETGTAEVIVPDYQLSLAIGKEGQNARLAARLTGWRVDIKSETQLAEEEAYQRRGVGRGRVGRRPRDRRAGVASPPRAARPSRPRSGPRPSRTARSTPRTPPRGRAGGGRDRRRRARAHRRARARRRARDGRGA